MFSTTITLIDAYPRSLAEGLKLAAPSIKMGHRPWLNLWIFTNCGTALIIIWTLQSQLKLMVDIVTTMAFLAGPFFAYINFKLIRSKHVKKEFQLGTVLKLLSHAGLLFLTGFALIFNYHKLIV